MNQPPSRIDLGGLSLTVLDGGTFRLDGAALYGIYPRVFWEKLNHPDADNRVMLGISPAVVTGPEGCLLIDPGIGSGWGDHARDRYDLQGQRPLEEMLAEAGVNPDEVGTIVATHLHFDHVAGAVAGEAITGGDLSDPRLLSEGLLGQLEPALPEARLVVQRAEFEAAEAPDLRTAQYVAGAVARVYEREGRFDLIDGDVEPMPGVRLELTGGHTPGHQVIWIEGRDQTLLLAGDLIPTTSHVRSEVLEGVDVEPAVSARVKAALLARAAERNAWLGFYHAPRVRWGRIRAGAAGAYKIEETETVPSRRR